MKMTTQKQIRKSFWARYLGANGVSQHKIGRPGDRDFNTNTRCAFVDYVDSLQRDGTITEALAARVTLA